MVIPSAMIELDESDAAFGESSGHQAIGSEGPIAGSGAIEIEGALRLFREIGEFGNG